jgi:phage terminase small subunit
MAKLANHRHELFAHALARGETGDAAYIAAGYLPNRNNASRLKANESVRARVAELQERAAAKTEMTIADVVEMLVEDRLLARELEQSGSAVSATMGVAKVLGFLKDRVELTGKDGGPIEHRAAAQAEVADLFGEKQIVHLGVPE